MARKLGPGHTVVTCLCDNGQVSGSLFDCCTYFILLIFYMCNALLVHCFVSYMCNIVVYAEILRKAVQQAVATNKG